MTASFLVAGMFAIANLAHVDAIELDVKNKGRR
jgi:hypothetical protein